VPPTAGSVLQPGSASRRRDHFDAGAVAGRLKQREAQRILLSAKHAAYQPFTVFSNPIASAVLAHFEVMQGKHGRRRKARHLRSANLLFLSLSRAANTIGRRSLCCETLSVSLALTSHKRLKLHHPERHSRAACLLGDIWASYPPMARPLPCRSGRGARLLEHDDHLGAERGAATLETPRTSRFLRYLQVFDKSDHNRAGLCPIDSI